jgi:uncharacterized membrane protein YfcA
VLFELGLMEWCGLLGSAILIGMAKVGVQGTGMATIPILALLFGAKDSTGIALGMLVCADIMAVIYYHRHADWTLLWRLFPAAALGVALGTVFGNLVSDALFKQAMVLFIAASIALMVWQELRKSAWIPKHAIFANTAGILGGIATMVGNMAGPIMAVYLLSQRMSKQVYIGTGAWFFLAINVFKIPFHVFAWNTITLDTAVVNVVTVPLIALGAVAGIAIVKRVKDGAYRWFVIGMTAVSALLLLF